MRRLLVASLTLLALALSTGTASADSVIVRVEDDTVLGRLAEPLPLPGAFEVPVPDGVPVDVFVQQLQALPGVLYAEADEQRFAHAVPADPLFGEQWALPVIRAPEAWDMTTGSADVELALVDSGVDLDHPDLAPNLVEGHDFVDGDGTPADTDGHGTQVAGIAGAAAENGAGIAGVTWRGRLLPLRVLDGHGEGDVADAIRAYGWAIRSGARVVNVSWGGSQPSRAEREMIAEHPGVLFVSSAGNESRDVDARPEYPCTYDLPNVVCVAASDRDDALAPFSNHGARGVDLAAPGVGIATTRRGGGWALQSGTSMAAPLVSGTAALMLSRSPQASVAEVRQALLSTAAEVPALHDRVATGGRLDAAAAVAAIGVGRTERSTSGRASRTRLDVAVTRMAPARSLAKLLRSGLRAQITCSRACRLDVTLLARRRGRDVTLASGGGGERFYRAGVTLRVRLAGGRRRALAKLRTLNARLVVRATGQDGRSATTRRSVRLSR